MRVTLLHNPDAGSGVPPEELRRLIEEHGHAVVSVVSTKGDARRVLELPTDVVAAAGGDGTVSLAARVLAGHGVPLALLPVGTANNIATSLGLRGSLPEVIARWAEAKRQPFDLGRARGPWGERSFIEGVGGGLIARSIVAFQQQPADKDRPPREELIDAVRMHAEVLSNLKPSRWELTVDGVPLSGDYLLVAVLNIRLIGPNLDLCANVDPTDGVFSVVLVGEEHRDALDRHLQHRTQERGVSVGLSCLRATRVELTRGDVLHIDDKVFEWPAAGGVGLRVAPGALEVLI